MLDPRVYPAPTLGEVKALTAAGTGQVHKLTRMVTEISFGHNDAATLTLSCDQVLPGMIIVARDASSGGTADKKVVLPSGCTFDGTNSVATMNAAAEQIAAIAINAVRFAVVANVGGVVLGTS